MKGYNKLCSTPREPLPFSVMIGYTCTENALSAGRANPLSGSRRGGRFYMTRMEMTTDAMTERERTRIMFYSTGVVTHNMLLLLHVVLCQDRLLAEWLRQGSRDARPLATSP